MAEQEYIVCAANWYQDKEEHEHQPKNIKTGFVVCGLRHHNCIATVWLLAGKGVTHEMNEANERCVQGFLTSKDRFVDREEGRNIAFDAGQLADREVQKRDILFSEDLY